MIFNNKLTIIVQNCMKNNDEKLLIICFDIRYDVQYNPTNIQIKIPLVHGEIEKR